MKRYTDRYYTVQDTKEVIIKSEKNEIYSFLSSSLRLKEEAAQIFLKNQAIQYVKMRTFNELNILLSTLVITRDAYFEFNEGNRISRKKIR